MASVTSIPGPMRNWALRRLPDRPRRMTLDRRRIYILPTRYGMLYGLLLLVLLMGAMNYANSMVYGLTFLLAGQGLIAMRQTQRNLLGLVASPAGSAPAFAGDRAVFQIRLDNPSTRTRWAVTLESPDGNLADGDIAAADGASLPLYVATRRRGRLPVPLFVVSTRYPLGLFHAWSWVVLDTDTLVYPAPAERAPPLPPGHDSGGAQAGSRPGGLDDFYGLRKYQFGDSFRRIAWKAVAREQGVMTKQFTDAEDEHRWLDWASLAAYPPEQRASILCRWVLDSEAEGVAYGLRLPDRELPLASGPAHRTRCLEALALVEGDDAGESAG